MDGPNHYTMWLVFIVSHVLSSGQQKQTSQVTQRMWYSSQQVYDLK